MAFEDTPFGLGRPSLPLGTLEAIELQDYPETHLQPFRSERHGEALRRLARRVLDSTDIDLARLTDDGLPEGASNEQGVEQLIANLDTPDKLTLLIFENRWKRQGSLLGYVSLRQTEDDRPIGRATFTALADSNIWGKQRVQAIESLFAFSLERWEVANIQQPDAVSNDDILHPYYFSTGRYTTKEIMQDTAIRHYNSPYYCFPLPESLVDDEYNLRYTHGSRMHLLQHTRRFYSSRFGEIMTTFHWTDAYCELLGNDIHLSKKQVAINGLYMTSQTRRDLLIPCQDAIERGVSVEVNLDYLPVSEGAQRIADVFAEVGVKLQVRRNLPRAAVIDGRVWWDSVKSLPELERLGVMRRAEAERPIPVPAIQFGRLV